jgi:hypothetical protein
MADSDWAAILDEMCEASETLVHRAPAEEEYEYELYRPMSSESDVSPSEIRSELEYLEQVGLIEEFADEGWIRPSTRGVQVAHERHIADRQNQTNQALVAFTFALVLVGVIGNSPDQRIQTLGSLVVAIFLLALTWGTDTLKLPSIRGR